jgi:hypothetical protein
MSIQYTYEIVKVDEAARCMEVVYASEGRQTMHIGARLPFEGETLDAVIAMYSPVEHWRQQEAAVIVPTVGTKGATPSQATPAVAESKAVASGEADYPDYGTDVAAAAKFLSDKGLSSNVEYLVSMYNITQKALLANLFACEKHLVKVLNGEVIEWYEADIAIDGKKYTFVSKDLTTGAAVDKYILDQRGLVKFCDDASVEPTITNFGTYASMPQLMRPLLSSFEHREHIRAWSLKPYGLIVEYSRL